MAEKDTITTKFKVDISDLKQGITEANNQIKLANSQFKAASDGTKEWENSVTGIKAKLDSLKSVLEAQNSKLESYSKQLDTAKKYQKEASDEVTRLKEALDKAKSSYGENSNEVQKLEKELSAAEKAETQLNNEVNKLTVTMNNQQGTVNKTQAEMNKLETELGQVEKAEKQAADEAEDLSKEVRDAGDSANSSGSGFTVLKGALADLVADGIRKAIDAIKDFAKETIQVGMDFDTAMSQVAAVSGATGTDLQSLRDKAKEMGANTKFSATEAADAFNYMAMAGWKTNDMLSGIDGVLALAAAGNTDLATTSDIVTDALTAFGQGADQAGRLADIMAAASSNANTNIEMMGGTFKYVAPIAGALGYSMEDTAIATGLMANAGIKAEQGGTALRSIMTRLASPPKEAATAMDALGISITNADGTMKPFSEVMVDLRSKFDGLSESQQAQYAKALAGQEAMSGLLAIVNAAPADFEQLTNAVNNSSGAAQNMADIMQDNLGGDLTALGSKLEGVQLSIYEKFEPALRKGVDVLSSMLDGINWVIEHADILISTLAGVGTAVGTFLLIMNWGSIMSAAAAGIGTVTTALGSLFTVMMANPITLVISLIAGLVAGFITLWNTSEEFRNFWIGLWDGLVATVSVVVGLIVNGITSAWNNISSATSSIWNGIVSFLSGIWNGIVSFISGIINGIVSTITGAWNTISSITSSIFNTIQSIISGVWNAISSAISSVVNTIQSIISAAWNTISSSTSTVWNSVKSFITSPIEAAKSTVSNVINSIKSTITSVWNSIKSITQSVWNNVKSLITTPIETAKKTVSNVINSIKDTVKNIFNGIVPKLKLSLPHVEVDGGEAPWGIAGMGRLPSFKITWNRLGGVFDSPTIFGGSKGFQGLGEDGAEAVVPLERNKYWIRKVADEMLRQLNISNSARTSINQLTNTNTHNYTQIINAPKAPSRIELYRDTKNLLALKAR